MTQQVKPKRLATFWLDVESEAERRAWARTGFQSKTHLEEAVKKLPLEEKVNLLTRIFQREMTTLYFADYVEFQEKLGKKMVVPKSEMIEYSKELFGPYVEHDGTWHASRIDTETLELTKFYDNGDYD